jgi:hypothetical protein
MIKDSCKPLFEAGLHSLMNPLAIPGNPLGLRLLSKIPAEITKGELAKAVLPREMVFDYAIPLTWLDQFETDKYSEICCRCVTCYPPEPSPYHPFGCVTDLVTGTIYPV